MCGKCELLRHQIDATTRTAKRDERLVESVVKYTIVETVMVIVAILFVIGFAFAPVLFY